MPNPAQSESPSIRDESYARKARILLDLFGPSGVERLRKAGLATEVDGLGTQANARGEADRLALLERFRKQGLFEEDPSRKVTPPPSPTMRMPPLTARIADHLDEAALEKEHPAVIAMVLRNQPRGLQLQALHALPGPVARATIRYLRG
ncbi:hypothetical protein [Nioella sediminis]|jgi:hypothetical protein|uniref:hypothetical protein n=1 Tax=Nioella sediminis TaxID=1912092 RepID=UPI0008FCFA0A|nr:hypothetical protein [Nioella sediminis]TBX28481.1 hypothetical protein TK43_06180 [Roseovarius sp. JS7-11]